MISVKTKFTVGLFVILGLIVAIIAIVWLGMTNYFQGGKNYAAYFDESVQGLDKDAPVKYRGVSIGRVESIGVAPDATLIQVVFAVDSELKDIDELVAQLKSVGITGIMFVEIDKKKPDEPDLSPAIRFTSKYPVIATKPSGMTRIFRGIDDILDQFNSINISGITSSLKTTLERINQALEDADIRKISTGITATLDNAEQILDKEKWEKIIAAIEETSVSLSRLSKTTNEMVSKLNNALEKDNGGFAAALNDMNSAMRKADILMENGINMVHSADTTLVDLQHNLNETIRNLAEASENLKRLSQISADHPSMLFFGEAPEPKKIEPDTN